MTLAEAIVIARKATDLFVRRTSRANGAEIREAVETIIAEAEMRQDVGTHRG